MAKRLVVCLDGTWNNRDSSTNVLHHACLAMERLIPGAQPADLVQMVYYDVGVGTSPLDRVSGGAFGIGVDLNVREAYNWLVQHYHDGDEVYVFGFSRGAYTARSLVGFMDECGLLRRGASISVNQLWELYIDVGRKREHRRKTFADWLFRVPGKPPVLSFREVLDKPNRTPCQELWVNCCRHVQIKFLGVYDTVGSVGIDAFAIPGIRSKLARHHNMRPPELVQSCRHALAIDEYRDNFEHTPFRQYIGLGTTHEDGSDDGQTSALRRAYWNAFIQNWDLRIIQRWFVGAHSNIGGGYENNELAQLPLNWLLTEAIGCGLECEPLNAIPIVPATLPRDSYTEFGWAWTAFLRAKRHYRRIDPSPELRASHKKAVNGQVPAGYMLRPIHEELDSSVIRYWVNHQEWLPPNLVDYAARRIAKGPISDPTESAVLSFLASRRSSLPHEWLGTSVLSYAWLVMWATLAGFGVSMLYSIAALDSSFNYVLFVFLMVVAFAMALIDMCESRANFNLALHFRGKLQAARDAAYWARAVGVVLCVLGTLYVTAHLWVLGWNEVGFRDVSRKLFAGIMSIYYPVPFCAWMGVLVASLFDRAKNRRYAAVMLGSVLGIIFVALACMAVTYAAWGICHLFWPEKWRFLIHIPRLLPAQAAEDPESEAGLLMLLIVAAGALVNSLRWVEGPLHRARLGWSFSLQLSPIWSAVKSTLENWRQKLQSTWSLVPENPVTGNAAVCVRESLRISLYRDLFGFIPVYTFVFLLGGWFAAAYLPAEWWIVHKLNHRLWEWGNSTEQIPFAGTFPLWLVLPLVLAIIDIAEDHFHLWFVRSVYPFNNKAPMNLPEYLPLLSFFCSIAKLALGIGLALITLTGIGCGLWHCFQARGGATGWRGSGALALALAVIVSLFGPFVIAGIYQLKKRIKL